MKELRGQLKIVMKLGRNKLGLEGAGGEGIIVVIRENLDKHYEEKNAIIFSIFRY